jgi:hypothetical protein
MQTTTRATRAQLRRVRRRRAAERERAERARRVLARDTQLILDGVRQTRTVSQIHDALTSPIVGPEFALDQARWLEKTLQRLAVRSLLSTPKTRGYLTEATALCVSLQRQQPPHHPHAIDFTTERLAQTAIDQVLAANQPPTFTWQRARSSPRQHRARRSTARAADRQTPRLEIALAP